LHADTLELKFQNSNADFIVQVLTATLNNILFSDRVSKS